MQYIVDAASDEHVSRGRILLNVKAMREHGIAIGEALMLQNVSNQDSICIGTAWPSSYVNKDHVEIDSLSRYSVGVTIGDKVLISKLGTSYQLLDASKTHLGTSKSTTHMEQLTEGMLVGLVMYGKACRFQIDSVEAEKPNSSASKGLRVEQQLYRITTKTKINWIKESKAKSESASTPNDDPYKIVGGLDAQITMLRELVELPLHRPEIFVHFGIRPPRGVLLFGPPGTGKTLLATAAAKAAGVQCFQLSAAEVTSKYYGESESKLREIFKQAEENAPSIIFIDELDALAPKRDQSDSEVTKRVVGTLLALMDGMDSKSELSRVVVIATTNRPNSLDPALRRPGRFDREIEVPIPNEQARRHILEVILRSMPHSLKEEDISHLASITHGYVGADIASLCKEAALVALKRSYASHLSKAISPTSIDFSNSRVTIDDMMTALADIRPSAMREVMVDVPKVHWEDIGGYDDVKQKLREAVEWPIKFPEAFRRFGIDPPKGILLYGPPGCSKTLMAKALATEAGLNFIPIKGPELFNKYVGESEKAVRDVFRRARQAAPSIVFFDEIDAVGVERGGSDGNSVHDRVLAQLLNELDGIEALKNVLFLAATNRPDIIDKALMRPGRLDRILYVGPPDTSARRQILQVNLRRIPHKLEENDIITLADKMEGLTGAEITSVCREAALVAIHESMNAQFITLDHVMTALSRLTTRTVTPEMIAFFTNFQRASRLQSV